MWRPRTLSDVQAVIGVPETSQLDFKRAHSTPGETAKDIAAMTVEGGVIGYGIDEQGSAAANLTPVPLRQAEERLRQIASSSIHPPPAFDVTIIEAAPGATDGFVIVEVPASPLAPHMWNERYPARSGTTTRYLTELEVARLYDQRRALRAARESRHAFEGFLDHSRGLVDDVRAHTAIFRLMVAPVGSYEHPRGARVREPLERATDAAARTHGTLVASAYSSSLLDHVAGTWGPLSTLGFEAGATVRDYATFDHRSGVAGAATYSHAGPLSFEVVIGLTDRRDTTIPPYAHEQRWVSECLPALLLAGIFFSDVPGVSFATVDISLWGLDDRIRTYPTGPPPRGLVAISDNNYSATGVFSVTELASAPQQVASALLDRLLASFVPDGQDVLRDIAAP
jgi:hypothetical protein